jgi:hypothetical protein
MPLRFSRRPSEGLMPSHPTRALWPELVALNASPGPLRSAYVDYLFSTRTSSEAGGSDEA